MTEDFGAQFLDRCAPHTFERSTTLLVQGEPVNGMYLVAHGAVEITSVNRDGQSILIHLSGEGEVVGDVEALAEMPAAANCIAADRTVALFCPRPLLCEAMTAPIFMRNILRTNYDRLLRDNATKFVDQFQSVGQRLCACLYRLSSERREIAKTQADLAGFLGCARQTLNRELGRLRDDNVIALEKGRICVRDRNALLAMATARDWPGNGKGGGSPENPAP